MIFKNKRLANIWNNLSRGSNGKSENKNVFALNGVTGMLIATVLLLSILVALTCLGIKTQQKVMQTPYVLENPSQIERY